jgi:hypothetical protein
VPSSSDEASKEAEAPPAPPVPDAATDI